MNSVDSQQTRKLLTAIRSGDASAVEKLMKRHRRWIKAAVTLRFDRRFAARLDPSDVVQEACGEAARRIRQYAADPRLSFRIWMRRIIHDRLVMLTHRRNHAQRRDVNRELPLPARSSAALGKSIMHKGRSPSEDASFKELATLVRRAVAKLPEKDREIVLMLSFEGMTSAEAGEVLKMTPEAVRKRLGRAVLKLREKLSSAFESGDSA